MHQIAYLELVHRPVQIGLADAGEFLLEMGFSELERLSVVCVKADNYLHSTLDEEALESFDSGVHKGLEVILNN